MHKSSGITCFFIFHGPCRVIWANLDSTNAAWAKSDHFFGSKPKLYKLQPAERAQISAKTNAHFHTFPQMTANWKNVSGNLESIDFSTWRFAGIWLTWSPYLANGCNSFRACPEYFDQKFEHFKVEHMWSSRNFRIEPRTKKMNENDTNGGPDVYILYFFLAGVLNIGEKDCCAILLALQLTGLRGRCLENHRSTVLGHRLPHNAPSRPESSVMATAPLLHKVWKKIGWLVLGGELPTARGCGLVHPSDWHGIFEDFCRVDPHITGVN